MLSTNIFYLNGLYDILCSVSILTNVPFIKNIHLSMFKKQPDDPLFTRFFAYWIFTYGIMRMSNNNTIIAMSYLIESAFFLNEWLHHSVHTEKALFVIYSSIMLAMLALSPICILSPS